MFYAYRTLVAFFFLFSNLLFTKFLGPCDAIEFQILSEQLIYFLVDVLHVINFPLPFCLWIPISLIF